ncbi:hypothetical protein DS6A_93 [Mycobacterium phage DS6A]|uniref:Helix-turn-helix domain-containing protein n=1 Tax=Mycobacterium phage DS6A TaxID=45764 RepID=G8I4K3_9CAUD|nr:hypothetical protein DS6A_93 [Mycobacterium phage DS6A]AER47647.1 hypothetical protein DS6A_93 [Mycobacterium phage DS6A]
MTEDRAVRNKRVALDAIGLLERIVSLLDLDGLRAELAAFHDRWAARGVHWTRPPEPGAFDLDAWLTADDIAELADVSADAVRRWHYRGHITRLYGDDGRPRYNVGEVVKYQARRAIR